MSFPDIEEAIQQLQAGKPGLALERLRQLNRLAATQEANVEKFRLDAAKLAKEKAALLADLREITDQRDRERNRRVQLEAAIDDHNVKIEAAQQAATDATAKASKAKRALADMDRKRAEEMLAKQRAEADVKAVLNKVKHPSLATDLDAMMARYVPEQAR